jgi:flagellar assembly factor FliW
MRIPTRHWGEQEIDDERTLSFPDGLPGFASCHRFAMLGSGSDTFLWLQSLEIADVALPVAEAFSLFPDYQVELDESDEEALGIRDPKDVALFLVVTVRSDPLGATANQMAPIVVNTLTRIGRQKLVSTSEYSVRAPLFPGTVA